MVQEGAWHADDRERAIPDTHASPSSPRIVPLREPDVEAAARFYTGVFLRDEPTTRRHAPDPVRFLPYARFYVRSLVSMELSFLARDESTGELIGFVFCIDLLDDPAQEGPTMVEFLSQFGEAVAMIDELEARHLDRESIPRGSSLHIFQIGVDGQYRGRGTAQALIRRALVNARDRGFEQAVADCTNSTSKHAFERCGFAERGFSSYESFDMDGVRFFSGLEGGIFLMVKDLHPEDGVVLTAGL